MRAIADFSLNQTNFILPPTQYDLRQRLSNRSTDSVDVIEHRLGYAVEDMRHFSNFDYVIINDDFNKAVHDLEAIITASRLVTLQQHSSSTADRKLNYPQSRITESWIKAFYTI